MAEQTDMERNRKEDRPEEKRRDGEKDKDSSAMNLVWSEEESG